MVVEVFLPKQKEIFFWLILKDRLNTRGLLKRRNLYLPYYNCVFCALNVEEDLVHLLFHCPFSMACWYSLHVLVLNSDNVSTIIEGIKDQLRLPFFLEIIVTMCWAIWIMRNDIIFKNLAHSVFRCKAVFRREFAIVKLRAKASYHPKPLCNFGYLLFNHFCFLILLCKLTFVLLIYSSRGLGLSCFIKKK